MGFEIVVRPVVLPDIRPAPARSLPPADDPTQGFAVIRGNGGHQIDLTNSYSASTSSSSQTESEATFDEARVHQKNDDGSINKKNFVDIRVRNKSKFMTSQGRSTYYWIPVEENGNVILQRRNLTTTRGGAAPGTKISTDSSGRDK